MCDCCIMTKKSDGKLQGQYCGDLLPKNSHINGAQEARIFYDIYVEHFYLCLTKSLLNEVIYPINCCPNCGAKLFDVWDATRKDREGKE